MEFYYLQLYNEFRYELDYPINELGTNLSKLLGSPLEKNPSLKRYVEKHQEKYSLLLGNSYRTAAEYFEVIENHTTTVLVPYEKGKDYIAKFNRDRKSTRLNSSHVAISYAVFCLKKKKKKIIKL